MAAELKDILKPLIRGRSLDRKKNIRKSGVKGKRYTSLITMAAKRALQKMENKTPWQSTPSASHSHPPTKAAFENRMPFTNPPSPVLLPGQQSSEEGKNGTKKLSTLEMIAKAIEAMGQGRKGSSVPAIKKWILGNYNGIESAPLNLRLRKALAKGLETGTLERSNKSSQMTGAKGFFIVKAKAKPTAKKDPKKKPATSKPTKKGEPRKRKGGHVSDSEVTIIKPDRRKSAKLHVSDTDLPPDSTILQMKAKPKKGTVSSSAVAPKAKKEEKPKVEKKTSHQKTNDAQKPEKNGKTTKPELTETSKNKTKKTSEKPAEKQEVKKKEKPVKSVAAKAKKSEKLDVESSKTEQSSTTKKSLRNK